MTPEKRQNIVNGLVRLNKHLADLGYASRRKAEEYILEGKVRVNGKTVTELGTKIDPSRDKVEIHGLETKKSNTGNFVYYKINKPFGYECSMKPMPGSRSIYEFFADIPERVFSVGRLDKDSEGLILMTNDGRVVYKLTHPKFEKEKEYEVTVDRNIEDDDLKQMANGVVILGKKTSPCKVDRVSKRKFNIVLKEGMNRQIRRMCRKLNYRVHKLKRLRVGEIVLSDLRAGYPTKLNKKEMDYLLSLL